jgi:hypothetical protein
MRRLQDIGLPKDAAKALGVAVGIAGAGAAALGFYYLGEKELDKRLNKEPQPKEPKPHNELKKA